MGGRLQTVRPPSRAGSNFSNFSIGSNRTTQSTAFDSTEIVFTTADNSLDFEKKDNLMDGGKLADGIQTVKIPKWTNAVKIFLGEKEKGEAEVFYTTVRLPKKVLRNRLRGHYTKLYVRAARPGGQGDQELKG